jgi:AraC family transcriptional regulator
MLSSQIQLIERNTGKRFAAAPDGTVLLSSEDVGWRGISVELHSIPPLEMPEHYLEGHRLMVHTGNPTAFEWKDGTRWQKIVLKPGDFCLQTHGEINIPRWHDPLEFLAIAIDRNFVRQYFQDTKTPETIVFGRQVGQSDPIIARFAKKFQAELAAKTYCGSLYGESLALAFSVYLLEQYRDRTSKLPRVRGKLSALQLRQFVEYIHEHLSNDLSLVELANQLHLSPFYFTRLVKNSLGLSPHQYVLQTRIERAKYLISVPQRLSLAEIGLQVGFYDHAHFTKAFKQMVGVSPRQFFEGRVNEQEFTSTRDRAIVSL